LQSKQAGYDRSHIQLAVYFSPARAHAVVFENRIAGDELSLLRFGLRHQHAVERVAMRAGHATCGERVFEAQRMETQDRQMINVRDAKAHFSKLLEQAHAGQEIILSKAGKPYARLMPLARVDSTRQPGRLPEIDTSQFFGPLPDSELAAWEGNL
jgi:prevent-host-death family protein